MDNKLTVLDLFSGIGGFSLGLERTGEFRTKAFCEIDPFCRQVLAKHWPAVPIHEDIRRLTGEQVGPVDVICGGFPCQPFSLAGKRGGQTDDRHLWPEMCRLISELRPAWVIGENVAGIIGMALDGVLSDLENLEYACRTFVIPACAVNAPHRRERVWILAYADQSQPSKERIFRGGKQLRVSSYTKSCDMGNPHIPRLPSPQQRGIPIQAQSGQQPGSAVSERGVASHWSGAEQIECHDGAQRRVKPGVRLLAHGIPGRVARLKALGNAVVPQIPEMIGRAILDAERVEVSNESA